MLAPEAYVLEKRSVAVGKTFVILKGDGPVCVEFVTCFH